MKRKIKVERATQVRIPTTLFTKVTKIVEETGLWVNEDEFIREALRRSIASIKENVVPE